MASNLACVGLSTSSESEFSALLNVVLPQSRRLASVDGVETFRWQDPSGARLVVDMRGRELLDFLPSFAGRPGVQLADCRPLNADVVTAAVVDEDGEQITAMAFEAELQRTITPDQPWSGMASVVAFGTDVSVFADELEFETSPLSQLDPDADPDEEPPPHIVEHGLRWPTRMAAEAFISYGLFGAPEHARAYARLNGIVTSSDRRCNRLTGIEFTVCRVRCLGFEVDALLDATHPTPAAGAIVAGTFFLAASIDEAGLESSRARQVRRPGFRWRGRH